MKKTLLTFLLVLALCLPCFVGCGNVRDKQEKYIPDRSERENDYGLKYTLNDDGPSYSVTGVGSFSGGELVIPKLYRGLPVTGICDDVFNNCSGLTSVVIPDGVTSIGDSAFSNCSGLTSVVVPDSVTNIGNYVFSGCDSLKYNEYDNAYYLGNKSNPYLILVKSKDTSITSCKINNNTKFVHSAALQECYDLTSVTIPDSVTSIGVGAFFYCNSLKDVYITDISAWINISFGDEEQNNDHMNAEANPMLYADNLYLNGEFITELVIPDGVTSIRDYVFHNIDSLERVVIPDSVTSIGDSAFSYCESLTSVVIPDSVTSMYSSAFWGCDSLTSVYYTGSKEQWAKIVGSYNSPLTNATIVYNYVPEEE